MSEWLKARPAGRGTVPLPLLGLAALGAALLLVVAVNRWTVPGDEHAYWLAARRLLDGAPLYDPAATAVTPYAFWYPPIVAQLLAPVAAVVPSTVFSVAWIVLMLGCLFWLADRRLLLALALVAFPPVAIEFWFRNVHLVLAVLVVLGLRRWSGWFAIGAGIKVAPGLGIVYLAAGRQWRRAAIAAMVGAALLVVSVLISPTAWAQFAEIMLARGPGDASGFLPIPYVVRAVAGLALAVLAGSIGGRRAEVMLVAAIVVALPTLWVTALSTLVALVPLLMGPAPQTRHALAPVLAAR